MADAKKIITICWNKAQYTDMIKSQLNSMGFDVKICTDFSLSTTTSLKPLLDRKWNMDYLVVLCELKWSHETENASHAEMNGIKLVQYLRSEKNIAIPILFVSFLNRKQILTNHPWAEIICTPALKHGFCQLPSNINEWIIKLTALTIKPQYSIDIPNQIPTNKAKTKYVREKLTNLELKYTKQRFCGIDGLIAQINHHVSSCRTKESFEKKFKILKFAIANKYIEFEDVVMQLGMELKKQEKDIDSKTIHMLFKDICHKIMHSDQFIR